MACEITRPQKKTRNETLERSNGMPQNSDSMQTTPEQIIKNALNSESEKFAPVQGHPKEKLEPGYRRVQSNPRGAVGNQAQLKTPQILSARRIGRTPQKTSEFLDRAGL
jgi:hypothetical protein